jgi:stage II sporulation protein D
VFLASPRTLSNTGRRRLGWLVAPVVIGVCLAGIGVGPASAQAITFTFYGRGDGHGIGMSQWGAQGAAQQGWSANRILALFYRGTTVTKVPSANIRVQLAGYASQFGLGTTGAGELIDTATGTKKTLSAGVDYVVRPSGSGAEVIGSKRAVVDRASKGFRVLAVGSGFVQFDGRPYRGSLSVTASGGTINAINTVPLESYLRGVVPSEMPSGWAAEALKAQAIAARSYALRNLNPSAPFDVYPDQRSQVYGGVDAEAVSTNAAVGATADEAVTYHGVVVEAFFASSDGGYTESVQNGWGGTGEPYLVGVPDPFDAIAPSHIWKTPPKFTGAQLGSLLGTGGTVKSVDVLKRGVSPRVMLARVTLTSGSSVELTGSDIEALLGLQSTWFWVGQSNQPTPKEPPIGGSSSTTPTTPTTSHTPAGSYLVVLSNSSHAAASRRLYAKVARIAPGKQLIVRGKKPHLRYLVVAVRTNTQATANAARIALRRLGYSSMIMRAVKGDPAPRPAVTQTVAAHPASLPPTAPSPSPPPAASPPPAPTSGSLVPGASSGLSPGAQPAPLQ